jgi:hypothetical protein
LPLACPHGSVLCLTDEEILSRLSCDAPAGNPSQLMHRESRCAAQWHVNYGSESLKKAPDPDMMINLGKFSKFASVPMPLEMQLHALREERKIQTAIGDTFERKSFPRSSDTPVSEVSVNLWGDKAWHSQPKRGSGAPAKHKHFEPPPQRWTRRKWDIDSMQFVREGLAPAHVHARLAREGSAGEMK